MAFDPAKYRSTVLVPLSKDKERLEALQQVIRDLQGADGISAADRLDSAELFAVEPSMTAQELAGHLERLEMTYNKQKFLASAQLLKRLLELLGKAGGKLSDPNFWAGLAAARGQAIKAQLDELAQELAQEYPLKVVTPEQVAEQAAGTGLTGVSEGGLASALAKYGVTVRPDFEIPKVTVPAPVRKVTDFPEFRTIVDVVLRPEQPQDMAVIEELAFGSPPRYLKPSDVTAAKHRLQQQEAQVEERARHAAQNALAALTDYTSAADLHALTLALLAETTEDLLRRGKPRVTVRNELVRRGVREIDAARLVAKLSTSTQVLGLHDVAERLAGGALGEARRLYDALPSLDGEDPAERARIGASLAAAEKKKAGFLAQYDSALRSRDYVAAAAALRGALTVDTGDDDLRQRLARLPPLRPASLSLRVDGRALDVTWPTDSEESVRYCVVRTTEAVPVNHTDGDVLASNLDATRYRDQRPLVGRRVRYSVFATRDGLSFSDPTTATTIVLPSPSELNASPGITDVSLSWSTPPEAAGVVVTQTAPDGSRREHQPTTPGQLSVTGLITGTRYRFSARAIYLVSGDERRLSAAVEIDATPRGAIRAVEDLRIEAAAGSRLRAAWSTVFGYTVELWALPVTARVTAGTKMSFAALTSQRGRRLILRPGGDSGGVTAREFDPLPDVSLLVPVTVDGDGGLVGTPSVAGAAPSVQKPVAERFGEELRVSWEWPRGDYLIEVGWTVHDARHTRRVSRTGYNEEGGVRLAAEDSVRDVTLATVVRAGSQEWVSPPVPVPVGSVAPKIKYSLVLRRTLRGRGSATVTVESPQFRGKVQALAVLKEAKFMPSGPSDGRLVDRLALDFSSGPSFQFDLDLGKVARDFWVRLFPAPGGGTRFEDPPTSQMRG
ncbi:fibronectin type III domain-containing protein [Frankia sp. QA3]|uniref:fibronectin type III domain-containing protein n=1 Tax=Frankia sp. QA3 TaxID=710111 RepID=UPI000269C9A7|nr:fibronectin type III domain-containing protein [Frankia sp. QA3]EIV94664.1 hypothetical protein FraQA3DRAFT_4440 [Frankia sp. QA3]